MIPGILGTKVGMTHIFNEDGKMVTVTVIKAGPCTVTQIRTPEKEGYSAIQMGFGEISANKVTQPLIGHFNKSGAVPTRHLREFRVTDANEYTLGQEISVDSVFSPGQRVRVIGTSKGKGMAGVMKRYHFHGTDATHGQMTHRRPFSGGATGPAHVLKGHKNPGHMGNERVTQLGLKVVLVDVERNLLLVSGPVPGANGTFVMVAHEGRRKA